MHIYYELLIWNDDWQPLEFLFWVYIQSYAQKNTTQLTDTFLFFILSLSLSVAENNRLAQFERQNYEWNLMKNGKKFIEFLESMDAVHVENVSNRI